MPEERHIARCDSLPAALLPRPALPPRLGRFLRRIAAAALSCSVAPGQYETPCPAGSARRAAPARSLARALRGDGGWSHADARAGRRAAADRRLPDLTGAVFHGFPIRGMDLPVVPFVTCGYGTGDALQTARHPAPDPRFLALSSCAATGNATPCATWTNARLRPGSPSSCRRTARRRWLTLPRHFGVPWSRSPAPRGSQPCQPAGFSQAGAAIPSGRSEGDRRGGLTVKRPVDRRP